MTRQSFKNFSLFFGDVAVFYFSLFLTLVIRHERDASVTFFWKQHVFSFTFLGAIWIVIFFLNNLYNYSSALIRITNFEFFKGYLRSMALNVVVMIIFFYFNSYFTITPKTNLALFVVIFTLLFLFWRFVHANILVRTMPINNILLIDLSGVALPLAQRIIDNPIRGHRLRAVIQQGTEHYARLEDIKIFNDIEQLETVVAQENIATIIVDNALHHSMQMNWYQFLSRGISVVDVSTFWEEFSQEIPVTITNPFWFLGGLRNAQKQGYEFIKRAIELVLSSILGLFCLPFLPCILFGIKLTSSGPIFYAQKRVGKNGKEFTLFKFRTMTNDAEKDGPQWSKKNDSRVTMIGKFLRHTHLDEIPQLWNIFRGELSLIGPRPERPEFTQELEREIPYYALRSLVRPGLTGWAQINYCYGSSREDAIKKLAYDLYYIKNRSILLDIKIFLKTVAFLFRGEGR